MFEAMLPIAVTGVRPNGELIVETAYTTAFEDRWNSIAQRTVP